MGTLPLRAKVYLWSVVCTGFLGVLVLFVLGLAGFPYGLWTLQWPWMVISFASLVIAGMLPIEISRDQKVTLTGAVGFALVILSSPLTAATLGAGAATLSNVLLKRHWLNVLFNVGQVSLSLGLAGLVFRLTNGSADHIANSPQEALSLAACAVVLYSTNVLIVSSMVSLASGRTILRSWYVDLQSGALSHIALLFIGALAVLIIQHEKWALPLLAVPLYLAYRLLRANANASKAAAELAEALETQKRFVADASHQLRTPVTAVRGSAEVLLLGVDPPAQQELISGIHAEAVQLTRLVNNLLIIAQVEEGKGAGRETVQLDSLLADVCQYARSFTRNVLVEVERLEALQVKGDVEQLRQVFINLLDNAAKFTPAGGRILVSLYSRANRALVEVRDTGIGIPLDDLPHVFSRFYRARRQPAGAIGSGLGLSVAREIATAHGGDIRVESEVGRGSTFTVELPILSD